MRKVSTGRALGLAAVAACLTSGVEPAHAFKFSLTDDWSGSWDTTIGYGQGWRVSNPDCRLIAIANGGGDAQPPEAPQAGVEPLARRALDYLVGFTLSPVLWRKLPGSRSAGRVQSVALRLICDREAEIEAFRALGCEGLARVDFFLREDGSLVINEVNTLPGFTNISMYPKVMEALGISYAELVDRLIRHALTRAGLSTEKAETRMRA